MLPTCHWFVAQLFPLFSPKNQPLPSIPSRRDEVKQRIAPARQWLLKATPQTNEDRAFHFGASWCGWCKRLEKMLASPEVSKLFSDHYVLVSLTVQEAPDKKAMETPGADVVQKEMGGEQAGLPFYFFYDQSGKKLADSMAMPKGGNIGHPANPEEIKAFMSVIAKTAPRMTAEERAKIAEYLTKTMPKPAAQ